MTNAELLDSIQEKLHDALWGGDLEHGVAWLSAQAAERFWDDYPHLAKAIAEIMHMTLEPDE